VGEVLLPGSAVTTEMQQRSFENISHSHYLQHLQLALSTACTLDLIPEAFPSFQRKNGK